MTIEILRESGFQCYEIEAKENDTLLSALLGIKHRQDNTLTFRCGCKSGVCGSCAVRVNGMERLACKTVVRDGDKIEPLKNAKVIRDLVVDLENEERTLKASKAYLKELSGADIKKEDEKAIDLQSNCILCHSCYSSCPVYEVNENFLGPFALTRVLRYVNDKKEADIKEKIDAVQNSGVWDCTLCGNCTMVCPEHIDPKSDIMNLRNKSVQMGYSDPNMASFDSGMDFNTNFGFDPNGF